MNKEDRIGFILTGFKTPSIDSARFIVDGKDDIKVGDKVGIEVGEELIMADITNLWFYNSKYSDADTIIFNLRDNKDITKEDGFNKNSFLLGELRYKTKMKLGKTDNFMQVLYPPKPGSIVVKIVPELIKIAQENSAFPKFVTC